jgi:hypothetical protein
MPKRFVVSGSTGNSAWIQDLFEKPSNPHPPQNADGANTRLKPAPKCVLADAKDVRK